MFTAGIDALRKWANEIAAVVGPALAQIQPIAERILTNIQQLPDRTVKLQRNLAERGWYILPQMPISYGFALEAEFPANRMDVVDNRMSRIVEHYIGEVEAQLIADFPN